MTVADPKSLPSNELQMDRKLSNFEESSLSIKLTKTQCLTDADADCKNGFTYTIYESSSLPASGPRQMFLAVLILTSKFSQDKPRVGKAIRTATSRNWALRTRIESTPLTGARAILQVI